MKLRGFEEKSGRYLPDMAPHDNLFFAVPLAMSSKRTFVE
jgi:hypothetical protein